MAYWLLGLGELLHPLSECAVRGSGKSAPARGEAFSSHGVSKCRHPSLPHLPRPLSLRLFTIYKKIPEILVGNFRSARTVCVVYQLPKILGLTRRARLDSSYHMKLVRNSRNL